jgi:hypothetical protein
MEVLILQDHARKVLTAATLRRNLIGAAIKQGARCGLPGQLPRKDLHRGFAGGPGHAFFNGAGRHA